MKYDGHLNPTQITQIEVRTKWRGNIHREGRKRPKLPAAKVMNLTGKQHSNEFMFKFIEISKLIMVYGWSCLGLYTIQRHLRNCNTAWYQQCRVFAIVKVRQKSSFFELTLSACVWDCNSLHLVRYALSNSNRIFQKSQVTCWSKAGLEVVIWGDSAGNDHQEETEVVPLNHAMLFIFVRHWNKVCCVVSRLLQIF